jgi:SAM-dependent methyltransferase
VSQPNALSDLGFVRDARVSYDAIAEEYARRFPDGLGHRPLDRALLCGFAELVKGRGSEPVADVGSGPGYVTARLHDLGVPVFGVDVSPRMVALARRAHPHVRFHVGSMESLDLPDRTLGGLLALYSVIHVPDGQLPAVLAEFRRVLVPGGYLLLAFQTGDGERRRLTERFGCEVSLDYY